MKLERLAKLGAGVAVLGTISGRVVEGPAGAAKGIPGVQVEALDPSGRSIRVSITAKDGSYVLDDLKPGSYIGRVDTTTLPSDVELSSREVTVEVRSSGTEAFDKSAVDFGAVPRAAAPPATPR